MDEQQEIDELKRLAGAAFNGYDHDVWLEGEMHYPPWWRAARVYFGFANPKRIVRLLAAADRIATERTRRECADVAERQCSSDPYSDYDSGVMAAVNAILALSETQQVEEK